jgi:NTP pyrophosphatase (non-canonical NTP hydrolase)
MNLRDGVSEVRRKIGVLRPNNKADIEWLCRKIVEENREVFDRLAKT